MVVLSPREDPAQHPAVVLLAYFPAEQQRPRCVPVRVLQPLGGCTGTGFNDSNLHTDNDNNSLLPISNELREFGQIGFWVHLEDVDEDQAPLRLIPKRHGMDMTKCVPLVCKGGMLAAPSPVKVSVPERTHISYRARLQPIEVRGPILNIRENVSIFI